MMKSKVATGMVLTCAVLLTGCAPTGGGSPQIQKSLTPSEARRADQLNGQMERYVLDEVLFEFNKSTLSGPAQRRLDKVAAFMIANPSVKFSVTGHADAVGSSKYNRALGWKRAYTSAAYLIGRGVSFQQIMATVTMGEENLAVQTDQREVLNRRAVIEVFDFLDVPIKYVDHRGKRYPVWPNEAVNSRDNVCGGGDLADICLSANLLNIMDLDTSVQVSRNLQVNLGLVSSLSLKNPTGSVAAGLDSTLGNVVDVDATVGAASSTVGDTVSGAGGAVGGAVGGVGGAVGGLLGG